MTTRDPRTHDYPDPATSPGPGDAAREATQSLHLEPGELPERGTADDPDPSLARGTHNRGATRVESPGARVKTPLPPAPVPSSGRHAALGRLTSPEEYLDSVLGSYRVIELLGKGGMGYVYRAEHVKLGREVALKLLRSDYAIRRDAVARFFQEARTVNRVRHRNIVDVTDFVELDDGTTYIIMELLTGTSLGAWARSGIDLPRALAVLVQICDGLAAAHQVGVVHRDLKPDNVIIVPTSDGAELAKLLDFGVAKLLNRDDEDVGFQTAAGSVIGTPAYMSPEQAGGMVIDARSDIYSLGAIMYELFCGQPMFRGRSFGEYVRKHLTENPIAPRKTTGGAALDPQLEAVILRCLEKDPDQRYPHIGELRDALLHLFAGMDPHPPSGMQLPMMTMGHAPLSGAHPAQASQVGSLSGLGMSAQVSMSGSMPLRASAFHRSQSAHSSQHVAHSSGGFAAPAFNAQHSYAPAAAGTTPWWAWFVGGAVAVTLGIGAAVWYAERDTPDLTPRPAPSIAAATAPAAGDARAARPAAGQPVQPAAPRPALIDVRFDSTPSGSAVFARGRDAELCRTPCTLNVDVTDGGSADARAFVVRHAGFADGEVAVDLTSNKRAYSVELHATEVASEATEHPADRTPEHPAEHPAEHPVDRVADHPVDRTPDRAPARDAKRPGKHTAKSARKDPRDTATKDAADDDAPAGPTKPAKPTAKPDETAAKPDNTAAVPAPVAKPVAKPDARPTIDPSDTLDPFHHK